MSLCGNGLTKNGFFVSHSFFILFLVMKKVKVGDGYVKVAKAYPKDYGYMRGIYLLIISPEHEMLG